MKIAKIGVIAIVVVIASAGMGISYTSIYGVPISNQRASTGMGMSYASFNGVPTSNQDDCYYGHIGIRKNSYGDSGFDTVNVSGITYQSDKDVGSTIFENNGQGSKFIFPGGSFPPLYFWNETDSSPTLALNDVYPGYASSINFSFANTGGQGPGWISSVTLEGVDYLVIDDWYLKIMNFISGATVVTVSGNGKSDLFSTLINTNIVELKVHEYMTIDINFHFNNDVPSKGELPDGQDFNFEFVWWGHCWG